MPLPRVAYFSMEIGADDSLHTYCGGLGFLAGSHMLSAGRLNLPMVGVTILWGYGYGEQQVNADGKVEIVYVKREYPFLKETNIVVTVEIFGEPVKVKAYRLDPDVFGTVPIYFLTTEHPDNKVEHRRITDILYDSNQKTRISQEIVLGKASYRVLEAASEQVDVIHLNEGHALPVLFELLEKAHGDEHAVRERAVFTTHTPVTAGNESHPVELLAQAGFFGHISIDQAIRIGGHEFSLTVAALRMCRLSNAVSQLHGQVANHMWGWVEGRCPIIAITNAVDQRYWQDPRLREVDEVDPIEPIKLALKSNLFAYIQERTQKVLSPDTLTIVWARRFTQYKRPLLLFSDLARIEKLLKEWKIQLIFAGKFHPSDTEGREMFNKVLGYAKKYQDVVVMPNYELSLSRLLKQGADVWLNTPVRPLEASGTSGMSANMNAAIHMSTHDGWATEGTFHKLNGFIINEPSPHGHGHPSPEELNTQDYESMMSLLENEVIPMYYNDKRKWYSLCLNAMRTAEGFFHSDRMAIEYYTRLYHAARL